MKSFKQLLFTISTLAILNLVSGFSKCGIENDHQSMYNVQIVGGNYTKPHQFPWIAYLEILYKPNNPHLDPLIAVCDGSIINNQWILSAAHCFRHHNDFTLDKVTILLGAHNIASYHEEGRIMTEAAEVKIHENYDSLHATSKNDIAVLRLAKKIDFNQFISPICMPDSDSFDKNSCQAIGWGKVAYNKEESKILKKVDIAERTLEDCQYYYPHMDDTQICAGIKQHGPCNGDSGGPLQCKNKDGAWFIEGIVSFGSQVCTLTPCVFTRVSKFTDWIKTNIQS